MNLNKIISNIVKPNSIDSPLELRGRIERRATEIIYFIKTCILTEAKASPIKSTELETESDANYRMKTSYSTEVKILPTKYTETKTPANIEAHLEPKNDLNPKIDLEDKTLFIKYSEIESEKDNACRIVTREKISLAKNDSCDSFCNALNNHYHLRMILQKMEFFTSWILLVNILFVATPSKEKTSVTILSYTIWYIQISIASRVVAYVFDFSRALVKTNSIPEWLKLHHLGCVLNHLTMGYFILGRQFYKHLYQHNTAHIDINIELFRVRIVILLLANQASHNTWTKHHSKIMYWVNAFGIGLPCGIWAFFLSPIWVGDSITNHIYHNKATNETEHLFQNIYQFNETEANGISIIRSGQENNADLVEIMATGGYVLALVSVACGMLKMSNTEP